MGTTRRVYRLVVTVAALPLILAQFFSPETGEEYGVGTPAKLSLVAKMLRNHRRIPTGSTVVEHLVVATTILQIPSDVDGCVVECGSYKGGSTANLSLVAELCDRRLEVFDSFEGMPEPAEEDRAHVNLAAERVHTYSVDDWAASLDEVRANVANYGDPSACQLRPGYFEETLPAFDDRCALVFLDVGLRASAETCLEHLWPLLHEGGYLYTHDVKHVEIAALFFDDRWWEDHLGRSAPGLVGSGSGLGLHPGPDGFWSSLGYAVKNPPTEEFAETEESGVTLG